MFVRLCRCSSIGAVAATTSRGSSPCVRQPPCRSGTVRADGPIIIVIIVIAAAAVVVGVVCAGDHGVDVLVMLASQVMRIIHSDSSQRRI